MKKLLYVFATAALTMTMSCGNTEKANQSEKSTEDLLRADSVKKVEMAIEAQRQDSIRRDSIRRDSIRQDSIARRTRVTPDLAIFNLHGPVKSVTHNNGFYVGKALFSEDGKLLNEGNCKVIRRDEIGRIAELEISENGWGSVFTFIYDKDGRPKSMSGQSIGYATVGSIDGTLVYDERGFEVSYNAEGQIRWYLTKRTINYKYKNVDKYGNWTSRSAIDREISTDTGTNEKSENTETTTESRTITYYSK